VASLLRTSMVELVERIRLRSSSESFPWSIPKVFRLGTFRSCRTRGGELSPARKFRFQPHLRWRASLLCCLSQFSSLSTCSPRGLVGVSKRLSCTAIEYTLYGWCIWVVRPNLCWNMIGLKTHIYQRLYCSTRYCISLILAIHCKH